MPSLTLNFLVFLIIRKVYEVELNFLVNIFRQAAKSMRKTFDEKEGERETSSPQRLEKKKTFMCGY